MIRTLSGEEVEVIDVDGRCFTVRRKRDGELLMLAPEDLDADGGMNEISLKEFFYSLELKDQESEIVNGHLIHSACDAEEGADIPTYIAWSSRYRDRFCSADIRACNMSVAYDVGTSREEAITKLMLKLSEVPIH